MSTSKVKLKLGAAEVEMEGDDSSIAEAAYRVLEKLVALQPTAAAQLPHQETGSTLNTQREIPASEFDFSVNTIGNALKVETATDLLKAACIKLCYVEKRDEFTRQEILDAAKEGSQYYKQNMSSNLSKYMKTLTTSGYLLSRSSGKYSLSKAGRDAAEAVLGNIG